MTKFGFSTAGPCAVLALTAALAAGPMTATAAAQTRGNSAKSGALAGTETKKDEPAPAAAQAPRGQQGSSVAPAAGLNVVKDPETGKLRGPDRAEAAKFGGAATNRSIEGLRPERRANGVTLVNLEGRFQSYTVATKKSTGGFKIECQNTTPGHTHADEGESATTGLADPEEGKDSAVNVHAK